MFMSRYALNLPASLKQEAEQLASTQGVSLNQFILWAVAEKVGALHQRLDDPAFPHISYRRGAAGLPQPVLRGTGIRVQSIVVAHHDWRMSASQIAAEYELDEARVRQALGFYQAHRAEIDCDLEMEERMATAHG
jgi:uncharacterized protein (DUF433 family)